MPNLQLPCRRSARQHIQGNIDAPNERALESAPAQADSELVRCDLSSAVVSGAGKSHRKDLIGFCLHMEQVLRAGLPMLDALTDLRDSITHPRFREVLANLISSVEGGKKLSQAMEDYPDTFDHVFVSLIAVGEESGELAMFCASRPMR